MQRGDLVIWKASTYYGDFRPDELAVVVALDGESVVCCPSCRRLTEHLVDGCEWQCLACGLTHFAVAQNDEVKIMAIYDLQEHWVKRENIRPAKSLAWMVNYIIVEGFGQAHLDALSKIVGLFNDCEEAQGEIFKFANDLYGRYAR